MVHSKRLEEVPRQKRRVRLLRTGLRWLLEQKNTREVIPGESEEDELKSDIGLHDL